MKISRLLCLFVFGLAACNSRQPGERDAQIEEQRKQIAEVSALSKQQSEQIARLTESLQSKEDSAQQEKNRRPAVTGSAYIMRKSADSTILRDLEVVIFRPAVEALWRDSIKDESKYHTEFKGDSFKKFSFDLESLTLRSS